MKWSASVWLAICLLHFVGAALESSSTLLESHKLDERIDKLKWKGRKYLTQKKYKYAAKYYSAVLQLIEGIGGQESEELRRKCCLTLAECELQEGQFYCTIARCSEVIEEAPIDTKILTTDKLPVNTGSMNDTTSSTGYNSTETDNKIDKLRASLAKAFYRRGISLNRLEKPQLAILDLQKAKEMLPSDNKIINAIDLTRKSISTQGSSHRLDGTR